MSVILPNICVIRFVEGDTCDITIKKTVSFHPISVSFVLSRGIHVITIKKTVSFHRISVSFYPISVSFYPISASFHPISVSFHPISVSFYPISVSLHPISVSFHPISVSFVLSRGIHVITIKKTVSFHPIYQCHSSQYQCHSFCRGGYM